VSSPEDETFTRTPKVSAWRYVKYATITTRHCLARQPGPSLLPLHTAMAEAMAPPAKAADPVAFAGGAGRCDPGPCPHLRHIPSTPSPKPRKHEAGWVVELGLLYGLVGFVGCRAYR
jgi:hypothetical protein